MNSRQLRKRRIRLLTRNNRCSYCGAELTLETSTLDHVVPRSSGGRDIMRNLALACHACNLEKGSMSVDVFLEMRRRRAKWAITNFIQSGATA
jgi:5-methylcytosine-specific restriction endonuclease McrA